MILLTFWPITTQFERMELAKLTRRVIDGMRGKESSIENGLVVRRLEYKVGKKFKVLATEATSHRNFGLLLFWVLPNCSFQRRCALDCDLRRLRSESDVPPLPTAFSCPENGTESTDGISKWRIPMSSDDRYCWGAEPFRAQ